MQSKSDTLKLIKTIAKSGSAMSLAIQQAIIASVYYSINSGDITIGQKLMESLNPGVRSGAVSAMLCHYGQFAKAGKSVKFHSRPDLAEKYLNADGQDTAKDEAAETYVNAIETHWTTFKVEKPAEQVDCLATLQSALSKCNKALAVGGVGATNSEVYMALSKAMEQFVTDDGEESPEINVDDIIAGLKGKENGEELLIAINKGMGYDVDVSEPEQQQKAA